MKPRREDEEFENAAGQVWSADALETASAELTAGLEGHLASSHTPPLGIHWCFRGQPIPSSRLGPDGLLRSDDLPDIVPYAARRAAGGHLQVFDRFPQYGPISRRSRVSEVAHKKGRSGGLSFVDVEYEYFAPQLVMRETRTTVYCENPPTRLIAGSGEKRMNADRREAITLSSLVLFRYSAVTGNTHLIHFDEVYAREREGYSGLVVHGPLQATLLMNAAAKMTTKDVASFSYRAVETLTAGDASICIRWLDDDRLQCWIERADGTPTMLADVNLGKTI